MEHTNLKPCPFCGGKVEHPKAIIKHKTSKDIFWDVMFYHKNARCLIRLQYVIARVSAITEQDAIRKGIDAWNTRTNQT